MTFVTNVTNVALGFLFLMMHLNMFRHSVLGKLCGGGLIFAEKKLW